jgi:GNAT superfamily N-acetyltransferase
MFTILKAKETYTVRHQELRQGKPLESCIFIGDDLDSTLHFGYKIEDDIVAVVSAFQQKNSLFDYENQYQIRGMAVLSKFQGTGIGKKLFVEMEQFLISKNVEFIWFNARLIAVPFYKSISCEVIGDLFDIEDVGPHYLMYKKIK